MKGLYLRFIISFFLISAVGQVFAQQSNSLTVEGKVSAQEGNVAGAVIQIYQDGRRLDDYGIGGNGRYKLDLNYNHKFELIFKLANCFSQKIVVETELPADVLQSNPKYPAFPVSINLFAEISGIDRSFSEKTVLKIYYSPNVGNFIPELYYNDAQIKNLINQAVAQSKVIGKEADYLSKLTRAERAELRKEYNQLLEQAGTEYNNEKFLAALDGFKAASKIFPNEQFPKDRIAEINDLLGIMMVASELDKALAERFDALIKEADLFFNQTNYSDARNSYNRALSIRPNDAYATGQINMINDILNKEQADNKYNELITQADRYFNEILYNEAIRIYEEAQQVKPNETYPKNRIDEINRLLKNQANKLEKQENYKQAMFQGKTFFNKQFYDKAIASFQNALKYKPEDAEATKMIEDVRNEMKLITDRIQYDELIKTGDKLYRKDSFEEALNNYEKALALFPDEKYPKKRVDAISEVLAEKQNFADLVYKADNQFIAKNYDDSKGLYQQALQINSSDRHSSDRINEIDRILADQSTNEQYNLIIAEADDLFKENNYDNAKGKYTEALGLKSKEKYPKDKIAEINSIVKQLAETDQKYKQAIAKANGLYQQKKYTEARNNFVDAGNIKPGEVYPPQMISQIDQLIAEQERILAEQQAAEKARLEAEAAAEAARLAALQAEKDKNYAEAIARADNHFDNDSYENARNEYRTALDLKPEEVYPQERITEIGNILAQLSATQKAYEDAIAKADREFGRESFDAAKLAYNEAKAAKAEESYPDEMIVKIDSIVDARARLAAEVEAEKQRLAAEEAAAETARLVALQAEKDKAYEDAIARADNHFNNKSYDNARNEYQSALGIKSDETYPKDRINEITDILTQLAAAKKAYEDAIARGDLEFRREGFEAAKQAFNEAKAAKADEVYPDEMIAKIDSIVEARARLAAETEAENQRLAAEAAAAEAARLAALQAEKDRKYAEAIAEADDHFSNTAYNDAQKKYQYALEVKPEEDYPQQRIDEITQILNDLETERKANELLDKNYANLIQQADQLFNGQNYVDSRMKYEGALQLKSEEEYPQKRINEIIEILQQQKLDEEYRVIVLAADGYFKTESYLGAKTEYEKALELKPSEQYPKSQISKIDAILEEEQKRILAEQRAAEDFQRRSDEITQMNKEIEAQDIATEAGLKNLYDQYIEKADAFFNNKQYNVSRAWYYQALETKPDEEYAQQCIDEINQLVGGMMLSQRDKDYQRFIDLGDSTFRDNQLAVARGWYNQALGIKANEIYPKNQIAEIQRIINERVAGQSGRQFEENIDKATKAFEAKDYNVARFWYKKALGLRPNDESVKAKLKEIEEDLK